MRIVTLCREGGAIFKLIKYKLGPFGVKEV